MKLIGFKHMGKGLLFLLLSLFLKETDAQTMPADSSTCKQEPLQHMAYGTQPAWLVTGAVSTVKGSALQKSFTGNAANTLFGRLPGLTVRQGSGEPGADSPILNARGLNTFGPNGGPLILVDGYESPFEQLTPDEIESIVLLKDAASTAIYGMRGANGVLLVTTKRGQEGPLQVTFSTQQGFNSASRLPDFLGAHDYAKFYNEALLNDGKPVLYSADDLAAYQSGNDPFLHPDVNWYNQVLRKTSPVANYNLNLSGGNKNVRYFVLLNVLRNNSLYQKTADRSENSTNSRYDRYNFRTNIDVNLTKRLSASLTLGGTVEDKANAGGRDTQSEFDLMAAIPPNAFPVYNPNASFGGNSLYTNPVGDLLQTGFYTSNGRTLQAAFNLTEQLDMITEGLSVSASVSFNTYFRSYSDKTKQYERFSILGNEQGEYSYYPFGQETSLAGDESQSDQWRNSTVNAFIRYNRSFGKSDLEGMILYNREDYTITGLSVPYQHKGIGGRFTYAYNHKYIGEFTFGYNGSENFPEGQQYGFFPAGSLGWIASNEDFLKGSHFLQYLKVRGSYGLVGNDNIGGQRFMFNQYYNWSTPYFFGTSNNENGGVTEGSLANPDVTWEKEEKVNLGFDATILKHLDISLDLFRQHRYDILAQPNGTVLQFLGLNVGSLNIGKVDNKGWEATVRYHSQTENELQYFIEADAWYAKNKIVYNAEALQLNEYLYTTGRPIGQPFVLEAIGFFKDQADIDGSPKQIFTTLQPGDLKYKDQNGDGIIDQNDYYPIGRSDLPELTYALHAGFQYKGFDFSFLFQGVADRTVYLQGNYFQAFQNNGKISSIAEGRWTPETAASATYPRLSASNNLNNFQPSSFWQRDGSFIKLRSVELGFSIPERLTKKILLEKARIYVNGTNLFSFDHVKYTDPETLAGYPAVRTISIGARIQF